MDEKTKNDAQLDTEQLKDVTGGVILVTQNVDEHNKNNGTPKDEFLTSKIKSNNIAQGVTK